MTDVRDLLQEAVGSYTPRGDEETVERRVLRRHRRQRVSAGIVGLGLFLAMGWLGWSVLGPPDGPAPAAARVTVPSVVGLPEAEARAALEAAGLAVEVSAGDTGTSGGVVSFQDPEAGDIVRRGTAVALVLGGRGGGSPGEVPVPELPAAGIAVQAPENVALVRTDGSLVTSLVGYTLAGNPGAPGVWLERDGQLYSLNLERGALVPVSDAEAGDAIHDEGPAPALGPPPVANGDGAPLGRWRYAVAGPSATLAQWSGECEIPTAFWVGGASDAAIVTGEGDLADAPASLALGWAEDGSAIVLVANGECGGTIDRPGIYAYSSPGVGRLLHAVAGSAISADAWGTGLASS